MVDTQAVATVKSEEIVLSEEQSAILEKAVEWALHGDRQIMTIGGVAGTGKSILIRKIMDALKERSKGISIAVAAFTGKAVSVARRKGIKCAQTMHSLLYRFDSDSQEFIRVPSLGYDLVIIDEASMVNKELNDDLCSFGIKVLYVGDIGQLEPIGKNPNLMADPDLLLTTVHRQAKDSPIIQFSQILRAGKPFQHGRLGKLTITSLEDAEKYANSVSQIICGFNTTRHDINTQIRKDLKYDDFINVGDKLICLQNNTHLGVYNGMMGTVKYIHDIGPLSVKVDIEDELGELREKIVMDRGQFGSNKKEIFGRQPKSLTFWDYGYAVTCHKAQGSEWDSVLVIEEVSQNWNYARWSYTAATRASDTLIYCK